jgi:PAS domain S-box-containing protein
MMPTREDSSDLRRRAAEYLATHASSAAVGDPREALHELRVHQTELEMQNVQLRETQAALERARDRYFNLFDMAPVAYLVFDAEHRLQEVNLAGAELLGTERARLKGAAFFTRVAPEQRGAFHAHLNLAFEKGGRQSTELRVHLDSGAVRRLRFDSMLMPAESTASPVCLTACSDLTDQRQAEEALHESERRFRQLAAATDLVFWIASLSPEQMLYVSPAFARVWGFPAETLQANPRAWLESVVAEDRSRVEAAVARLASGGAAEPVDLEYRIVRPGGEVRWIQDSSRPILDERGRLVRYCGIARDISERKRAEAERLEFDLKLQETQKLESLGVMAGGIAHDFNNLLTGIMGNAGLAQMVLEPTHPVTRNLEDILTASHRAADLCRQMLAYSGRGRFVVEELDLGQAVRETVELLRFSMPKNAVVEQHLAARLPLIMADATQMRQVLMNLALNASEALAEGGGTIRVTTGTVRPSRAELDALRLGAELPEADYVFVEVKDSGCGMTRELMTRIFDPFFTTKFAGRGLGLAAVLGIVRAHQGAIEVQSEVGLGSTFRLLLPAVLQEAASAAEAVPVDGPVRASGTVLVVDDEDVVRSVASRILHSFGLQVIEAADGCEGLMLFKRHATHLSCVLLDLTMPHLSGEETFDALRRLDPNKPIVLMSGFTEHETLGRFSGKGLSGFLQKPFSRDSMWAKLHPVLQPGPAPRASGELCRS